MMRPILPCLIVSFFLVQPVNGRDWPTYRSDARRTAYTSENLPSGLKLHWVRQLPLPRPAFPEQKKLGFDRGYEPIVAGKKLWVGSTIDNSLTAYHLETGQQLWKYYANGPVRLAPAYATGRVLFACDDGHLYCLHADSGKLLWKHRGAPNDRLLLGNERLISAWPARGAPVVFGNHVYYAAGIWPFMGVFVYSVDLATGKTVWINSGTGSDYLVQQHNSPAFAGVAPQGYLVATERHLMVSGGRTVPALFDRKTGKQIYFRPGSRTLGKDVGGYQVVMGPDWYANRGALFRLGSGDPVGRCSKQLLLGPNSATQLFKNKLYVSSDQLLVTKETYTDKKGKKKTRIKTRFVDIKTFELSDKLETLHFQAGNSVVASDGKGRLYGLTLGKKKAQVKWTYKLRAPVWRVLLANEKLVAVDQRGQIYAFGTGVIRERPEVEPGHLPIPISKRIKETRVGELKGVAPGSYALLLGVPHPRSDNLYQLLNRKSNLRFIVVDSNETRLKEFRRAFHGLLGHHLDLIHADPAKLQLPKYFASVIYCDDLKILGKKPLERVRKYYDSVRPYGGFVWLRSTKLDLGYPGIRALSGISIEVTPAGSFLFRRGPLSGSASWTHQNGDVGNSLISADLRVKAPLGLLWFGGPSNREVLPRHGHGPTPQVIQGRLIIEGPDMLRAIDVYTGRLLWQREFEGLGRYYDNRGHQPGAGAIGSNYVSVKDAIYVAYKRKIFKLEPHSGKTVATFALPKLGGKKAPRVGYLGVYEDYLIVTADPLLPFSKSSFKQKKSDLHAKYSEGSKHLVVLDRHTGRPLWKREATYNFRHNAIVAAKSLVFCLDRMTEKRLDFLRRRGQNPQKPFVLYALNVKTGSIAWQTDKDVFGTWLGYSQKHGYLLQAGSKYRDRAPDESGEGMAVYVASTGERRWYRKFKYDGPPLLLGDNIITQGKAYDLLSGARLDRRHPLTGKKSKWSFSRNYGCNTVIGCPNLLTFRSAAAGYFDMQTDGGTGNFGGFRSSCTSNLIPADGVLAAPEYTRTCTCSYQNQCSLALVHMPGAEMWTFNSTKWKGERIRKLGINFGAPGDRRDNEGILWLDTPSVGGKSPDPGVTLRGKQVRYFRQHSSLVSLHEKRWVGASGVVGATHIRIPVVGKKVKTKGKRKYTVRLYFARPMGAEPSAAQDVRLQGKLVLRGVALPVVGKTVMKEVRNVAVKRALEIQLDAARPFISGVSLVRSGK